MKERICVLIACLVMSLLTGCEKARLDKRVKELCAKDGGIKVYETVRLPPEKFNQWGQPDFYKPTQGENALGSEYLLKQEVYFYRRGNPEMSRTHLSVFRQSDKKLLGELIMYGRGGGDMPGPWYESSFRCPIIPGGEFDLFKVIFLNEIKDGEKK